MTASTRPTPITRTDWRVVPVILSADEQVALNKLAQRERREKADMAALLIKLALEERGLLGKEPGSEGEREQGGSPLLPRTPARKARP